MDRPPKGGAEQWEQHASQARKRGGSALSTPEGIDDQNITVLASIATRSTAAQTVDSVSDGSFLLHSTATKSTPTQTSDPGADGVLACSNRAPFKGNTGWCSKGCSTVSSRPLSSPRTRVGRQELTPRPSVLEQLRDRSRSISQDMRALNRICCVEMATSTAPKASRRVAVRPRASQTRLTRTTQK